MIRCAQPYTLTEEFYRAIASAMPTTTKAGKTAKQLLAAAVPAGIAIFKTVATKVAERYAGEGAVKDTIDAVTDAVAEQAGEFTPNTEPALVVEDVAQHLLPLCRCYLCGDGHP